MPGKTAIGPNTAIDTVRASARRRGACKFKQCDITRAVKALIKAGVGVGHVEITPDGSIVITTGAATASQGADDLDRELAEFEARR
jgi:hypothetical protein